MSTTLLRPSPRRRLITPTGRANTLITSDRYTSPEFMRLEMDHVWARVWNIGGRLSEIAEPGDYITHQLGLDPILMVRQDDGSVRAFHNICPHRGNLLVQSETGASDHFTCSYHGWKFALDGELFDVQDPDDFPQGNPCGKLRLKPIACEAWAGFIWYNLDVNCAPLGEFLGEVKDILDAYAIDRMTRVVYRVAEAPCNYKCIHDNFCESYHLPQTHPQLAEFFDDDYRNTEFFEYDTGHSLMKMKGSLPSKRGANPDSINPVMAEEMTYWGLRPEDFEGRAGEVRAALQRQKRAEGARRGYDYFSGLGDDQLTDRYHFNIFPGTSITMSPVSLGLQRAEPHPTDPNKCIYEQWQLAAQADDNGLAYSAVGMVPFEEAPRRVVVYGTESLGQVADQDLRASAAQQRGFQGRGFDGAYLTGQESRIQQFHNCLDAWIEDGLRSSGG
ncbi:MAG: aromatic ring-hydroxylating dioxygenase subunit alpha [Sphingomonadales bacterium]